MDDSFAQARPRLMFGEIPAWKTMLSAASAVVLAIVFLVAGVWKIVDTYTAATLMIQAKVPGELGVAAALTFGVLETVAGVFLLVPRFRRWGAWLTGALLIAFMVYIGYHYGELRGQECSCFPWLKRTIGPGFFAGDLALLLMAAVAGAWARPSESLRGAAIVVGAVAVFALASFGVTYARQTGTEAPPSITVDGKPYSLRAGKHFLYFFDPECSHCYQAAKTMAAFRWNNVQVIGLPTAQPRFAKGFMEETGLRAPISPEAAELKKVFPYVNPPFGVAIENGRQKASFIAFEGNQPAAGLKKIGFVE